MATPRVVVAHRASEYDELLARHGTRGQVGFVLGTRGRALDEVDAGHEALAAALATVGAAIPADWRRASVERAELARFVFEPGDIVVAVGPDGLVANLAKYLEGQPVIGVDPRTGVNAGVLVTHRPSSVAGLLRAVAKGEARALERTMVEAVADDGQRLLALNEVFLGQVGHQSARYSLTVGGVRERQSSSGVIVGTGTGATGWCASLQRIQAPQLVLPAAAEPGLAWFVREPWPSPSTGADLVAGALDAGRELELDVESEGMVVFGDGMEQDRLTLGWGQRVLVRRAPEVLRTVVA
ncbi:NAD(+)/NADH kinase [Janibacter anophelis]|uniref:NAD(+)/NADH kinase n=1 Tax=Janibacter anophelis TaxID=319054 RepID=UPI0008363FFB|nr:NAD(+)/NADH kinase [Janibacter anophelis]